MITAKTIILASFWLGVAALWCRAAAPSPTVTWPGLSPQASPIYFGIYHRYPEVPTTAEAALDDMRTMGIDHLVFWLSTKELYPANAVDSPEFERFAGLLRERGLKIAGGVGTMLMWTRWAKEHPDWVMQNPAGERNKYDYPCWSNPEMARVAREMAAAIVRQAVAVADDLISSWFIYDEPLWGWVDDNCFCPYCQTGYRDWLRRHGRSPADVGFTGWDSVALATSAAAANNDLHAITTCEYREDTMTDFLAAEAAVVKQNDPRRRPVTCCIWPVVAQARSAAYGNHARKLSRALDFIMTDPYPVNHARANFPLQSVSPLVATLRDPAGRTPVVLIVQDFAEAPASNALPLPSQMRKLCFQGIGYGATGLVPFIYDCGLKRGPEGKLTQERYPKSDEFEHIARWLRDPMVGGLLGGARPVANVAVVFPQNWYRRYSPGHSLAGELNREFTVFTDLVQNHYQVSVIFPEDLADARALSQYQAVVATGVWDAGAAFGIGPAAERVVRQYVENGGAWLVSNRTRLLPLAQGVEATEASVHWNGQIEALAAVSRAQIAALPGDQVLAMYDDGAPAAVVRRLGRGCIGLLPAILFRGRLTDGERYVEAERRYTFDPTDAATSPRAAAVRQAVGDLMRAMRVPRPVELTDEQGKLAWYAQPMLLAGRGYRLLFVINWDGQAHDLRLQMPAPAGKAWIVRDLLTGETRPVTRAQLARGYPLHCGANEVRALVIAWGSEAARRLRDWRPTSPYAPVPD